ncbi:MAG TPA: hypothetical protein VGU01_13645 [Sphingomicrobium sp.]|nr:hypothetical protein [Sphingomicrobium sp.]
MNVSILRREIEAIDLGIAASDRPGYGDVQDRLWDKRLATQTLATHCIPNSPGELRSLLDILEERLQFIEDEPVAEAERVEAFEAIRRITANIREYLL